ncbi:MAG: DUF5683 domain-containing protein [Prevotellaceae bacterium]|nr:DUF5683 domain-containing protein [Prevotellaceae bacterium]
MREVIISVLLCVLIPVGSLYAQEYEENTENTEPEKISGPVVSKSFIKGLKGIDSLSVSRVCLASLVVPGYSQAYNRQYWKIPVIYGSGIALIYGGSRSKSMYKKTGNEKYLTQSKFYYAGAGLVYLGSLIDGLANYKTSYDILPVKSTLFSTFLPGLGQAYNGDYWKIPVIYGGFAFMGYWLDLNSMQYNRYRTAYNLEYDYSQGNSENPSEFNGRLSLQSIKNYRDNFRRNRDYAVLYLSLWYAVNVIDATVFAQLSSFDVSENLAFKFSPVIMPQTGGVYAESSPAIGLSMRITMK